MPDPLPPIIITRKSGAEPLHANGQPLPFDLLSFWQWSVSDLVSNVTRGRLAEFIVATALGISVSGVRNEWDAVDLITETGLRVEVKSAAHVQSWYQARLSDIIFRTPRTREWNASTNVLSTESRRQADVYVLALLHHQDKLTIDPLNVEQWSFFVVPTRFLNSRKRSQHSITLGSLRTLYQPIPYSQLAAAVAQAGSAQGGAV